MFSWKRKKRKDKVEPATEEPISENKVSGNFEYSSEEEIDENTGRFFFTSRAKMRDMNVRNWCYKNAFVRPVPKSLDGKAVPKAAMDSYNALSAGAYGFSSSPIPTSVLHWYVSQGFLGYQTCALIAQHWLISKACVARGEDAVRNGWDIMIDPKLGDAEASIERVREFDKKLKVIGNLTEAFKFNNIFGIRHILTVVDSSDKNYYEKPFNIDAIKPGTYKGLSQIDPYWISPLLDDEALNNPMSQDFYEPTYWLVRGVKIHKSHFVILKGEEVADVLKPAYRYGGTSLVQQLYERVYAAERTANEAPELAMSKRLYVQEMDIAKAVANQGLFEASLQFQSDMKNNHGFLAVEKGDSVTQLETTLSDFDVTVMTQYQLVAAIAKTPATRLLGTSPKGFNATGEHEIKTYHEELESVQANDFDPIMVRHYRCLGMSLYGDATVITHKWNPVSMPSELEQATLNETKARTDKTYFEMGVIDNLDVRDRIKVDEKSGYNDLADYKEAEPDETPSMFSGEGLFGSIVSDEYTVAMDNGKWVVYDKNNKMVFGPYNRRRQAEKARDKLGASRGEKEN